MSIADVVRRAALPVVFAMTFPAVALAGDKALAESLFQEGRRLLDQGQQQLACDKFAASQAQDPSPGTLLNLGKCQEALGKTATAWANYKEAETLARNLSRAEQEKVAAQRAQAIEPRLSRLRIDPPKREIDGLVVERAGVTIPRAALGAEAPVDPGTYSIEARAPGFEKWTGSITIGSRGEHAVVAIPELKPSAAAPSNSAEVLPPADVGVATKGPPTRTIGWVLTGVGGAAVVGGAVMGFLTLKQASAAEEDPVLCPDKRCTPAGRDEIDGARSKAVLANVGIGLGVAAAGAGIALIVLGRGPDAPTSARASSALVPFVGPGAAGVAMSGRF